MMSRSALLGSAVILAAAPKERSVVYAVFSPDNSEIPLG